MKLSQMLTYHTNMIKTEANFDVISGYYMRKLAGNLEAIQRIDLLLKTPLYTVEPKFKHNFTVICIEPHMFQKLVLSAAQLEGNDTVKLPDNYKQIDCYIRQNSLGIRWSNNHDDFITFPNQGMPWDEIHANVQKTFDDIEQELLEEQVSKAD